MFDRVAPRYDLVNSVLSMGIERGWRRRAASAARLPAAGLGLDVACGSGKLTAELGRQGGERATVVGLDFSRPMLEVAATHSEGVFIQGDALRLPFAGGAFDSATIAFGLRNLADPAAGLREMARVLRPDGRAVVLEFLKPPRGLAGRAYRLYLRRLLPVIGGFLSGQPAAYRYLSDTVDSYLTLMQIRALAESAGWRAIESRSLTMGTVGLVAGRCRG